MASTTSTSALQHAPTRPRLQSVNQDFSDLNEQVRQVAHIIRLPGDWTSQRDSQALEHVVRARAEWVLRWILDKLKDETESGAEARRTPVAWQLLECMIHILPVSRSAPHLRDASFTTVLERALAENFGNDLGVPSARSDEDIEMQDASESSETIHEESQPSRKRKRGTTETSPAKKPALGTVDPATLFGVIGNVLRVATDVTTSGSKMYDTTQTELMKMVLRTESGQASRILKFWLVAVYSLLDRASTDIEQLVDLSTISEIWEARIVDSGDSIGSSSEDFANECLLTTLRLIEGLKVVRVSQSSQREIKALDIAIQALERLLTRHLLAPSRAAFFAESAKEDPTDQGSSALASSLNPLKAMLLQGAQIEDAGETVPTDLISLFKAVPYLLDLAIRASPSRTPKTRLAERPWIQAVFSCLAECAGCSLKAAPEFVTTKMAVAALQSALEVLQSHSISMHATILKDLFWYHGGVKYPECVERTVHWGLIAALIELDASIFVVEPRSSSASSEHATDLAEFLFGLISDTEISSHGFGESDRSSDDPLTAGAVDVTSGHQARCEIILTRVVVPMLSAFSRNRNLLGFVRRWDDQLMRSYKSENRKAMKEKTDPIWEDRILMTALSQVLEQSLTQGQITKLIEEHAKRMDDLNDAVQAEEGTKVRKLAAYKKASSSAVIIPAILQSLVSDDIVAGLKTQLHSLFASYAARVRDDRYSAHTRLASSWLTLCQLTAKLWPAELHSSLKLQQMLLHPLIEQATIDLSIGRKGSDGRQIDSSTRAAAMLFLLHACDRLQTVSGSEKQVQSSVRKVVKSLPASQLEAEDHSKMMEIFCADFVQLLNHLDAEASQDSLVALLSRLTAFDDDVAEHISRALAQAVLATGSSVLQNAYSSALSSILEKVKEGHVDLIAIKATLNLQPAAMSRERREAILNRLTAMASEGLSDLPRLLVVLGNIMDVPNASANISTDGAVLFEIATQMQKQGCMSPSELRLLQQLCQKTLGHIIPNQTQAQSRAFLAEFQKRLNSITQTSNKVSPVGLALLRATILEQKDAQLLSVKQYATLLKKCLSDDVANGDEVASFEDVLEALIELFPALLVDANLLKSTTSWLRAWISDNADLESYIVSSNTVSPEVAEFVARLHKLVSKYKLYPDVKWLVALSTRVLGEPLPNNVGSSTLSAVTEALISLETAEKLALVAVLGDIQDLLNRPASYRILCSLISTLPDKISTNDDTKRQQLALLPRLCFLLAETSNITSFSALIDSIVTILNSKASFATQHSIECVLSVLVKLTSRSSPALPVKNASQIFSRICETSRLILVVHRSKLGGRSHILLPLLQNLLFCLFMPTSTRSGALPLWLRSNSPTEPIRLTPLNANEYARLISTLCNPPLSSISRSHQRGRKSKDLSDPIKAARESTSHFLYPLLASFCRFQLAGRLDPAVRVKLMPAIWDAVGTASLDKESLDAMFAGLGKSEKDVWRGVWGERESVHGRKERFVTEQE